MLSGKQCTGGGKIIVLGIFGKLIRNPENTELSLLSVSNTAPRKDKTTWVSKGRGLKGVYPPSCMDVNINLHVDGVRISVEKLQNRDQLREFVAWSYTGRVYVCICR